MGSCTASSPAVVGPAALSCQRNDSLAVGASYPPLILTVNVALDAPDTIVNDATVAGGGETVTTDDLGRDAAALLPAPIAAIPTLSAAGLAALALAVLALGLLRLARR